MKLPKTLTFLLLILFVQHIDLVPRIPKVVLHFKFKYFTVILVYKDSKNHSKLDKYEAISVVITM